MTRTSFNNIDEMFAEIEKFNRLQEDEIFEIINKYKGITD